MCTDQSDVESAGEPGAESGHGSADGLADASDDVVGGVFDEVSVDGSNNLADDAAVNISNGLDGGVANEIPGDIVDAMVKDADPTTNASAAATIVDMLLQRIVGPRGGPINSNVTDHPWSALNDLTPGWTAAVPTASRDE